ncbi:MAG: S24/S26 family peptidase [Terriglobales bacterium]
MSVFNQDFLMVEDLTLTASLRWNETRSALIADVLRNGLVPTSTLRLRVSGESMLPTLWPGDFVEIQSCSLEDLQPGEIVLALRDDRLFLHRLVASERDGFVLRGDSMPHPDPTYPREALLGRFVRRSGGKVFSSAMISRASGMFLCHCSIARRLVLKLHGGKNQRAANSKSIRMESLS